MPKKKIKPVNRAIDPSFIADLNADADAQVIQIKLLLEHQHSYFYIDASGAKLDLDMYYISLPTEELQFCIPAKIECFNHVKKYGMNSDSVNPIYRFIGNNLPNRKLMKHVLKLIAASAMRDGDSIL